MNDTKQPLLPPSSAHGEGDKNIAIALLGVTIVFETVGTLLMKRIQDGWVYTVICYACYFASLALFSRVLRALPLSVAYTTWCTAGTIAVCLSSSFLYNETISVYKWFCIFGTIPCVVGLYVLH